MKMLTNLAKSFTKFPRFKFSTLHTNVQPVTQTSQVTTVEKYSEKLSKHRTVYKLYDLRPFQIGEDIFIAPNATVIGQVIFGTKINIWHGAVVRADLNTIILDEFVTIGENCVLHTAANLPNGLPARVVVGKYCYIQPGSTLYSCELGKNVFVGYNTVIMEGSKIGDGVILDPNSVVPPGRIIPPNQHWGGNPIKFIRDVEDRDKHITRTATEFAHNKAQIYKDNFFGFNTAYLLKQNDLPEDDITFQNHRSVYQTNFEKEYQPRKTY